MGSCPIQVNSRNQKYMNADFWQQVSFKMPLLEPSHLWALPLVLLVLLHHLLLHHLHSHLG